jgi:hypothetical protein
MVDHPPFLGVFDSFHHGLHHTHMVEGHFKWNVVIPTFYHVKNALFVRKTIVKYLLDRHD